MYQIGQVYKVSFDADRYTYVEIVPHLYTLGFSSLVAGPYDPSMNIAFLEGKSIELVCGRECQATRSELVSEMTADHDVHSAIWQELTPEQHFDADMQVLHVSYSTL